jgi:putative addiction module killer protein
LLEAAEPRQVIVYADKDGWLNGLRDVMGQKRILIRLTRLAQGNYGDCEPVGAGVSELRMFFGPGYRVYFDEDAGNLVILLCGGDKSTTYNHIAIARFLSLIARRWL